MRRSTRHAVASLLALAACSSSKSGDKAADKSGDQPATGTAAPSKAADPAPAPAPPPPPPPDAAGQDLRGVNIRPEGDHTAVVDSIGGFRMDMPGTVEVEDDATGEGGVHVTVSTDDALIGYKIKRLPAAAVKDVDVTQVYKDSVKSMEDAGFTISEKAPLTLGGMSAYRYVGTKELKGTKVTLTDWMVEVPATATLYQIVISKPADQPDPEAWVKAVGTFRSNK